MKYFETHFEDYISSVDQCNLHPKIQKKVLTTFPDDMLQLKNVIFYGPPGTGKYSQLLQCVKQYSPSSLKYERKCVVPFNKQEYTFKLSDVHYEVDMSILGCNSKLLWHDIYQQIMDIISAKQEKNGIIVCKNFHDTHSELLDTFYSYMQNNVMKQMHIVFFLITEHISFLPDNILNCCHVVNVPRPPASQYKRCLHVSKTPVLATITNIKDLQTTNTIVPIDDHDIVTRLLETIENISRFNYITLREQLYNILIYGFDVNEVIWSITSHVVGNGVLKPEDNEDVMKSMYWFFKHYNNNYRPIYHLERYITFLIQKIHGIEMMTDRSIKTDM